MSLLQIYKISTNSENYLFFFFIYIILMIFYSLCQCDI